MRRSLLTVCVMFAFAAPVFAAAPPTQKKIQQLEARIKALEANAAAMQKQTADALAALQATRAEVEQIKASQQTGIAAAQPASEAAPGEPASVAAEPPTGANGNAFNPAMSVILNGAYAHNSLNPDHYVRAGFPLAGATGPVPQGLSIAESEVSLAANIDEKFYGQLTLTASNDKGQDHIGVEEAFIDTTSLPNGFSLRAGRFFSNIGYLNSHHTHTDKFYDRPLAYQAFLGNQYGDDGVQLRWVAPTSLFLEFGGEAFAGNNFPSGGGEHQGVGVYTLFAHAGGDIGSEASWLGGASMLKSQTVGAEDGFSGDNKLYIADGTLKWAPQGNFKDGGVTVRGEYFVDDRNGQYTAPAVPAPDQSAFDQPWNGQRRGAYIEGVYRINRSWEAGYRYDRLWADRTGPYASAFDPSRNSVMLAWLNSEFSLIRLQYSRDEPNPFDIDNVLTLQYQVSLGAHGAHKF